MGEDGFGLVLTLPPVEPEPQDPTLSLATGLAVVKCPVRSEHLPCGCQVQTNYCGATFDLMTLRGCAECVESGTQSTRSALVRETP